MNDNSRSKDSSELLLPGLAGSSPLGFVAAIGLLRILDKGLSMAPRMSWTPAMGSWVPQIWGFTNDSGELLDWLTDHLPTNHDNHSFTRLQKSVDVDQPGQLHPVLLGLVRNSDRNNASLTSWASAMTSDIVPDSESSQLQTVRRDYLAGNIKSILANTRREHLERTLFHTWDYADALHNQSLHLDPGEDRRHAHQWNRPSGDPDRRKHGGMLGANRLALEAFPVFVSVPINERLQTLGFTGLRANNTRWTWPIWEAPVTLETVVSILGLTELQHQELKPESVQKLRAIGVKAAFRSRRILVGKTPNFTPPEQVA